MLERIGWEPLEGHRAKARVTILYWIVHNLVDIPVANHLTQAPTSGSFKFHSHRFWGYQHAFFSDSVCLWETTCPLIYVVDSAQVAKLHVLKTAKNYFIYIVTSSIVFVWF